MLTIEEARTRQKRAEKRALIVFFTAVAVAAAASACLFVFADLLSRSAAYRAIPAVMLLMICFKSDIRVFFQPKEFVGEISKIDVFRGRDQVVKGAAWGHGPNVSGAYLCTKFTITDKQSGKTIERAYRNNADITKLAVGDKLAVLRFVEWPVVLSKKAPARMP